MRVRRMLFSSALILMLTAPSAYAVPNQETQKNEIKNEDWRSKHEEFERNPIEALEAKKKEILKDLKEKRITKEKADRKMKHIEKKIIEIKDFERLSLQEKKELLIKDCEKRLNYLMENKKLNKEEAEGMFVQYVEKINNWDGKGYPIFHVK